MKYLGLQNNVNRLCKSLSEIEDKIIAILEPENIESDVKEPVHEMLAELTLKVENMRFKDSEQSFEKGDDKFLNTRLSQREFPNFRGNPLEWQSLV